LKHGELRISGRRTKNGQQLSGEPLEVLKAEQKAPSRADRVFVDELGDPLRYDAILEDFQQACKRAKIVDGFTDADNGTRLPGFRDLRRTFARVANRACVPHGIIMEIAGLKGEAMLLRYLGNSRPAEQRAAFERFALST
jgi:integrase